MVAAEFNVFKLLVAKFFKEILKLQNTSNTIYSLKKLVCVFCVGLVYQIQLENSCGHPSASVLPMLITLQFPYFFQLSPEEGTKHYSYLLKTRAGMVSLPLP